MKREFVNLSDENAGEIFRNLIKVFKKFISRDDEIGYLDVNKCYQFDCQKIDEVHQLSLQRADAEVRILAKAEDVFQKNIGKFFNALEANELIEFFVELFKPTSFQESIDSIILSGSECSDVFDYIFRYDDKYFALDMSRDLESYGIDTTEYRRRYSNDFGDLVYCELRRFNEFVESSDTEVCVAFVYNLKTNQVVERVGVISYSVPVNGIQYVKKNSKDQSNRTGA